MVHFSARPLCTLDPRRRREVTARRKHCGDRRGRRPPTRRTPGPVRFHFRRDWRTLTGAAAANLEEFHHEVAHCNAAVVHHHAAHGDFSRWLRHVIRDDPLADTVRTIESRRPLEPQLEDIRQDILAAIETRYLGWPRLPPPGPGEAERAIRRVLLGTNDPAIGTAAVG